MNPLLQQRSAWRNGGGTRQSAVSVHAFGAAVRMAGVAPSVAGARGRRRFRRSGPDGPDGAERGDARQAYAGRRDQASPAAWRSVASSVS